MQVPSKKSQGLGAEGVEVFEKLAILSGLAIAEWLGVHDHAREKGTGNLERQRRTSRNIHGERPGHAPCRRTLRREDEGP